VPRFSIHFTAFALASMAVPMLGHAQQVSSPPGLSREAYEPWRENYPEDGVEIGRGWFQHKGRAAPGRCLIGEGRKLVIADVNYTFDEIMSREKAAKALNVSLSAKYGAFSGRASFAQSTDLDRSMLTVMAVVTARRGGEYFSTPNRSGVKFEPSSLATLINSKDKNEADKITALSAFARDCGDSYISAIENGATYAVRFTRALDEQTKATVLGASAAGGFGKFKASVSMTKSSSELLSNSNTKIASTQKGGELELPLSAAEGYNRIGTFASKLTDTNTVPQFLVLRAYESHPDFPAAFVGLRTPGQRIAQIAGMSDRFADLANEYLAAYFARYSYQFPFQIVSSAAKPCEGKDITPDICLQQELQEMSLAANLLSVCLDQIVLWCREDTICDIRKIPKQAMGDKCTDTSTDKTFFDKSIMTPRQVANLPADPTADAAALDAARKRLLQVITSIFTKRETVETATTSTSTFTLDLQGLAMAYLKSVSNLPLNATADGTGGDIAMVVKYCTLYANASNCDITNLPTKTDIERAPVEQAIREWVFSERLGKIVSEACSIDLGHPLCRISDAALTIASGLAPKFTAPRRFPKASVALPVIVQPPPPPPPPPFCRMGGGKSNAGGGGRCDI